MIVNGTRLLHQWLAHETYGVNALLASMPRVRRDGTSDPAPPPLTIYDDIDDESVSQVIDPPEVPALVLFSDSDPEIDVDVAVDYAKGETPILFRGAIVFKKGIKATVASRNGGYYARAIRRSCRLFNKQELSRPRGGTDYRTLNGITVMKMGLVTEERVATALGRSLLWGFVRTSLTIVDTVA